MARIALRNVKIHDDLSEETTCFTATVYVDGKRSLLVRNHGHGGCNEYDATGSGAKAAAAYADGMALLRERAAAMPEEPFGHGMEGTFQPDVDYLISTLLSEWEVRRDVKRWRRTQVLTSNADGSNVRGWKHRGRPADCAEFVLRKYPDQRVLSEDAAVEILLCAS